MCIIVDNREGVKIDPSIVSDCTTINPDGFGFLDLETRKLIQGMSMKKARQLLKSNRPYVAHCRLATRGSKSKGNCHPFPIPGYEGAWLFHNGTIGSLSDAKSNDSAQVAKMLSMVDPYQWVSFLSMLDSRFLLVEPSGAITRVGHWHEHEGAHYSKDNVLPGYWNTEWWEYDYGSQSWVAEPRSTVVSGFADSADDDGVMVGVYGTLKRGHGNHVLLKKGGANFVGHAKTVNRYRLAIDGLPYLVRGVSPLGANVELEVYSVSDALLADIDQLESHPHFYRRQSLEVEFDDGGRGRCEVYMVGAKYAIPPYYASYPADDSAAIDATLDDDVEPFAEFELSTGRWVQMDQDTFEAACLAGESCQCHLPDCVECAAVDYAYEFLL